MRVNTSDGERRLQERLLQDRRVEGDRLMLDDATLRAALGGSRPLTSGERNALQASPLTARRLRQLALEGRAMAAHAARGAPSQPSQPAPAWRASRGMLRAAGSVDAALAPLHTDDGWWTLHFAAAGPGWHTILQLSPHAPFAAALLAARARVVVLDGGGAPLLEGRLDVDGECEAAWPHAQAPDAWLQAHGAAFQVTPA